MRCLHCGDCCLRMSPISAPEPCPNIVVIGTFYLCGSYSTRPEECVNHSFPSSNCPIGLEKLGINEPEVMRRRVDQGWELCKSY